MVAPRNCRAIRRAWSWRRNGGEYPVDELIGVDALRFGFEARDDAMPQRVVRDAANVVGGDEVATVQPCNGATALIEGDGAAWTRTVVEPTDEIGLIQTRLAGRHDELDQIFLDTGRHVLFDDLPARLEYVVGIEAYRCGCIAFADGFGAHQARESRVRPRHLGSRL